MRTQDLVLKQTIASVGVNVPLHIPDVTDIEYPTKMSTTSTYDITHPPTYERLHRHFLPEKEGNNKLVPY